MEGMGVAGMPGLFPGKWREITRAAYKAYNDAVRDDQVPACVGCKDDYDKALYRYAMRQDLSWTRLS